MLIGKEHARCLCIEEANGVAFADDSLVKISLVNGFGPNAEFAHEIEDTLHELVAHAAVDTHADSHLLHKTRCAGGIERMGKCGFKNRCCIMYPDEIDIEFLSKRNEAFAVVHVDTHLRGFAEVEVARMDINHEVCTFEILNYLVCSLFCHRTVHRTREDAVHIEVEVWYASLEGVDAERIECWIDFNRTIEFVHVLVDDTCHFIATELPFEFVAMSTRDHTQAAFSFAVLEHILSNQQSLIDWQSRRNYCLYHWLLFCFGLASNREMNTYPN